MCRIRLCMALVLPLAVLALLGCGSGDGINHGGKLTGKITIDGKPVSAAEIILYTDDGKHSVSGRSLNDGTYTVNEPPLGKCKMSVKTSQNKLVPQGASKKGPVDFTDPATGEWPVYVAIPERYEDVATSGLVVEVKKGLQEEAIILTTK